MNEQAVDEETWLIWYEDASVQSEVFVGESAEESALARFDQAGQNWTCRLFREVLTSGRADREQREPCCWPCFKDWNEREGLEPYSERADGYVSSCNLCGHDHGE